jgi:hypothetical protein
VRFEARDTERRKGHGVESGPSPRWRGGRGGRLERSGSKSVVRIAGTGPQCHRGWKRRLRLSLPWHEKFNRTPELQDPGRVEQITWGAWGQGKGLTWPS